MVKLEYETTHSIRVRIMKKVQAINAGSMADIAFLLLVFFLITTTIEVDYGISSNIAKPFELPDSITVFESILLVNQSGKLMLNDKSVTIKTLKNDLADGFKTANYTKNVLVVKSDRDVQYEDFIGALNESKRAFKVYHNKIAQNKYGISYLELNDSLKARIATMHPVALAEDVVTNLYFINLVR